MRTPIRAAFFLTCAVTPARPTLAHQPAAARSRDLGILVAGTPGPYRAITGVGGVGFGYATLILGSGAWKCVDGSVSTITKQSLKPVVRTPVQALEKTLSNLVVVRDMDGITGKRACALPKERLRSILQRYSRDAR